jgi:hypothetical protein
MDLKIDGSDLTALIEKATIEALGKTGQEALIKEVIRYLTASERGYSGNAQPSPLMRALHTASDRIATRVISEKLEKDEEFVAQVEALYKDAFRKFNDLETREKLVTRMADKLGEAFSGRGY